VPCVDVVVERRYPLLFLEKKLDGSFITRTSAQEEHARRLFEVPRAHVCVVRAVCVFAPPSLWLT